MDLNQLLWEVFQKEGRRVAELRLTPEDALGLTEAWGAQCRPMDNGACTDGKTWYQVTLPDWTEQAPVPPPPAPHTN